MWSQLCPYEALADALLTTRDLLDRDACWLLHGRFHFPLAGGWTFAISLESAGRLRLDACYDTVPRDTLWVLAGDRERLVNLVRELSGHPQLRV